MLCEVIRDDLEVSPGYVARYQDRVIMRDVVRNGVTRTVPYFRKGAILKEPDAYRLVQHGCAIAADDECAVAAARTPEELERAQHAYERLRRNIPREHWAIYDAGYISGVTYDGDKEILVPGPRWDEYQAMIAKQQEDDDE
jgi:hypothetical protein